MTSTRPAVAAIVPAYNGTRFLPATLASIAGQQPPPDEFVVVDDGSADGTAALVRSLCPSATVIVNERNEGTSAARNRAVAATTAEWIACCDHDDVWPPGRLAALLAAADGATWVCGRIHLIVQDGYDPPARAMGAEGTHVPYLLTASLIHRSVWDGVGGLDTSLRIGEDMDFYLRAKEAGHDVRLIDTVTLDHLLHPSSATVALTDQASDQTFAIMRSAARRRQASRGSA